MFDKFEDEVWGKLIDECMSGNMAAIKLYFELAERYGKGPDEGVVIIDDISGSDENCDEG